MGDNKLLAISKNAAVYRAIVLSTPLYGVELWTNLSHHILQAQQVYDEVPEVHSKIRWWYHVISNKTIL